MSLTANTFHVCKLAVCVGIVISSTVSDTAWAVDRSQLWLPRNYYRHFKALYSAAAVAEQSELCRVVIAGTLSEQRSEPDHPVFKITCRDMDRKTFAYIIDGLSMEILNRPPPPDPEQIARQEKQRELEQRWLVCQDQLSQRTQGLRGLSWLSQVMPEATVKGENHVAFDVDFNANGKSGTVLKYRGTCEFDGADKTIQIHARLSNAKENGENVNGNRAIGEKNAESGTSSDLDTADAH